MGLLTTARARRRNSVTTLVHTWGTDDEGGALIANTVTTAGVPCSVFPGEPIMEVLEGTQRWTTTVYYRLHFDSDPGVKPRDELVWIDGTATHSMVVVNGARNVSGTGTTYEVFAVERI